MGEAPAIRDGLLICGGKYHDIDFVRLELLTLFAEQPHHRFTVASDYRACEALGGADFLVTYTCEVLPDEVQTAALERFVADGGRWFALHGTNSALAYRKGAGWYARETARGFMELVGSQFQAHPPIAPYPVQVTEPDHPLVAGIEPFEAEDELYLCDFFGAHRVLLHADFAGEAPGFVRRDWSGGDPRRPVMYLKSHGAGEILYFNLGHARGHFDMRPFTDYYEKVERGSWPKPEFKELLRRGVRWAAGELDR